jgi:hypothetical protein
MARVVSRQFEWLTGSVILKVIPFIQQEPAAINRSAVGRIEGVIGVDIEPGEHGVPEVATPDHHKKYRHQE